MCKNRRQKYKTTLKYLVQHWYNPKKHQDMLVETSKNTQNLLGFFLLSYDHQLLQSHARTLRTLLSPLKQAITTLPELHHPSLPALSYVVVTARANGSRVTSRSTWDPSSSSNSLTSSCAMRPCRRAAREDAPAAPVSHRVNSALFAGWCKCLRRKETKRREGGEGGEIVMRVEIGDWENARYFFFFLSRNKPARLAKSCYLNKPTRLDSRANSLSSLDSIMYLYNFIF